jgi:hypothetical protein
MTRISDINNPIESHVILSNVEVSTDGIILPFDESMNINPSKYKRLGLRKIKFMIDDNQDQHYLASLTLADIKEVVPC